MPGCMRATLFLSPLPPNRPCCKICRNPVWMLLKTFPMSLCFCRLAFWLEILPKFCCGLGWSVCLVLLWHANIHWDTLAHVSTDFLLGCPTSMWVNFSLLTSCLQSSQKHHYSLAARYNATVQPPPCCWSHKPSGGFQHLKLTSQPSLVWLLKPIGLLSYIQTLWCEFKIDLHQLPFDLLGLVFFISWHSSCLVSKEK